jgi:hypothetical protein
MSGPLETDRSDVPHLSESIPSEAHFFVFVQKLMKNERKFDRRAEDGRHEPLGEEYRKCQPRRALKRLHDATAYLCVMDYPLQRCSNWGAHFRLNQEL